MINLKNRKLKIKSLSPLLLTIIATLILIIYILKFVSLPQIVYSDEGDYIWTGHVITRAIRQGNWQLFWQLTYPQFHYPFFQSWYLGFATLPFEYTTESSRLASLILLLPTIILVWFLARKLNRNIISPLVTCGLILTSPLTLYYFSNVMKEGLATFLTLLTFFVYFQAREKKNPVLFLMVSTLTLALTLTKYNYGALVLLTLGVESIVWLLKNTGYRKKDFWFNNILLYLPFLIGFAVWIFYPINRFGYLFPFPQSKDIYNLDQSTLLGHLLYYPLELAFSYTFSWVAFVLLAFGFIWALKSWRNYQIRVLAGYFIINFFLAEQHVINNQARYIFTSVPAFFLTATFGLIQSLPIIKKNIKKVYRNPLILGLTIPFATIGIIILIKDFLIFPKIITGTGSHNIQSPAFYEQDYKDISGFDFNRSRWPKIPPPSKTEKISDVITFVLENVDLTKKIFLVGGIDELNRGIFDFYLEKAKEKNIRQSYPNYFEYLVVLQVKEGSRFDTLNYRYFAKLRGIDSAAAAKQTLADKSFAQVKEKYFPYLGLTVTILTR